MTKQGVSIRSMTEEDIKEVVEINREIIGEDRTPTYDNSSRDPKRTYAIGGQMGLSQLAEADGKVVGFILGRILTHPYFLEDSGVVTTIGVIPGFQHKGIATRLVKAFKEECIERKIRSMRVLINANDKIMASFYQSLGFEKDDIVELCQRLE